VELFKNKTHLQFNVSIRLDKKIPMQAGLGGGSGNAATVLYALNKLLNTQFSDAMLAHWGSTLGADVPCFFSLGRVFCEGIGEKLTPVVEHDEVYWIAKPQQLHLSTASVYARCDPLKSGKQDPQLLLQSFQSKQLAFVNDLEEPAFSLLPMLKTFKQNCLDLGFKYVMMTGSGTAFICIGDVINPILPNTLFIKAHALSRKADNWYTSSTKLS
jgi:4-diphosphocytidyl-2-C-methyl-D-erythritol kinase